MPVPAPGTMNKSAVRGTARNRFEAGPDTKGRVVSRIPGD
jgi:hypothetical protein